MTKPSSQKELAATRQALLDLDEEIFQYENNPAIVQSNTNAQCIVKNQIVLDTLTHQQQRVQSELQNLLKQQRELQSSLSEIPQETEEDIDLSAIVMKQESLSEAIHKKEQELMKYSDIKSDRKRQRVVPVDTLSSEELKSTVLNLQSKLNKLKEDIQFEDAEESSHFDDSLETLLKQRNIIEEGMKSLDKVITQTNNRVKKLNESTFSVISEQFKSFCKRLVRLGWISNE